MRAKPPENWSRVVIERVLPEIDEGRFAAKCVTGERVAVRAEIYTDGHDKPGASVFWKPAGADRFSEVLMRPESGDWFAAEFPTNRLGEYSFTIAAWVDEFRTWYSDLQRRLDAGQDISSDLLVGAAHVRHGTERAQGEERKELGIFAQLLADQSADIHARTAAGLDRRLHSLMTRLGRRTRIAEYPRVLRVRAERPLAQCSAWYELFPRSASRKPGLHGTLKDVEERLPEIAAMGFDILYLPPIHPIGTTHRKGRNNSPSPEPGAHGSPWAIGAAEGGHKAIHRDLGTLDEFDSLVRVAHRQGLEIALDIAFQVSPDHPYVREHPEWFKKRPDGSIQYAENPPKKYQDIYPFDFECEDWPALWAELKSVFEFWISHGVKVFRVDNPHTKPFRFWEWCLGELHAKHPDTIYLSEAFTRPAVMYHLAKLGFSQSYTYFPWRNGKWELASYAEELAARPVSDFFRPNHWPNTPDILTAYLQHGGRPAFVIRLLLAATLGANYGIYGPAFEVCEHRAVREGSEEYLDSEKYQIRAWQPDATTSLRPLITRVNRIRRNNAALWQCKHIHFHPTDNETVVAYSKKAADASNHVLCIVELDPHFRQSAWVDVQTDALDLPPGTRFAVRDLITDARYVWEPGRNYVELDPHVMPAHLFRVERLEGNEVGPTKP